MTPPLFLLYLERECEYEREDSMRPAGLVVHVGGSHRPRLVPLNHEVVDLLGYRDASINNRPKNINIIPFQQTNNKLKLSNPYIVATRWRKP